MSGTTNLSVIAPFKAVSYEVSILCIESNISIRSWEFQRKHEVGLKEHKHMHEYLLWRVCPALDTLSDAFHMCCLCIHLSSHQSFQFPALQLEALSEWILARKKKGGGERS